MNTVTPPTPSRLHRAAQAKRKKACLEALSWLAKTFPEPFDTETQVRPLKIGIIDDIFAYMEENNIDDISKSKLRQALVLFTRRMEYLVCLKGREPRIDLHGQTCGEVTETQALAAGDKIKQHVEGMMESKHVKASVNEGVSCSRVSENSSIKAASPKVVIKRKVNRRFDPEAVARFKEKLGIAKESV